jgi:nitrous oxidase accessory protein NosD
MPALNPIEFLFAENLDLANGSAEFFETGTTTPKIVYDKDGGSLGTSVSLNAKGRHATGVFTNGITKVVTKDSDTNVVNTYDGVPYGFGGFPDGFLYDVAAIHGAFTDVAVAAAISAIGSDKVNIYFDDGAWTIDESVTLNANSRPVFHPNAVMTIAATKTATFAHPDISEITIDTHFAGSGTVEFTNSPKAYPEWWGIDGTADEAQINLAANALLSNTGVVLLGHNDYSTAAAITLPTGITLRGMNSTVSRIVPASTMEDIITTANSATDVIVEDLWVYGTGTTNTVERGVYGDSPTRLIVRNCRFDNMTYGVQIDTGLRCDVINNHFNGIVGAAGVSEGYGTIITLSSIGCKIIGNTYKTIARHGVYITSGSSYNIVSNNVIDTSAEGAIEIQATIVQDPCIGNQVIGNNILTVTSAASNGHGITLTQYCLDTIIIGNYIDTVQDYGIYLNGHTAGADTAKKILRGVIKGNIVKSADYGIYTQNAEDFIVSGNVLYTSTTNGIQVTTAGSAAASRTERMLIEGNTIITAGADGIAFSHSAGLASDITLGWNDITDVTGTDLVQVNGITGFRNTMNPLWIEDVIDYADFDQASTTPTHDFTITLPAGAIVDGVWWNLDTEFAGGSVSAATLEFGVSGGDVDGFFPAEDVFTGAGTGLKDSDITSRGALLYDSVNNQTLQFFITGLTTLVATLRLTGANGTALTAGQVRVWISYHQVKLLTT